MNEPWAISTLQFKGAVAPGADIEHMVAPGELVRDQDGWHVDYRIDSDRPLGVQLEAIESFLVNAQELLVDVARGSKISLHLSWTPREPQDGIVITERLIKVMARLNIFVLLDTYIECD